MGVGEKLLSLPNHQAQPGSTDTLSSTHSSLGEIQRATISLLSHLPGSLWSSGHGAMSVALPLVLLWTEPKKDFSLTCHQEYSDRGQSHRPLPLPPGATATPGSHLTDIM